MKQKNDYSEESLDKLSKEKLEELVKELTSTIKQQEDFLLNISHDLRNPINIILSILQCLKYIGNEDENDIKKKDEYVNLIRRNALKMIKLIDNLIDTTKLEGNYYKINKRNLDIVSIVENTVTSIDKYAEQKGIQLVFDTNVEECITAVDPECIDRIIMNLLSNAIKFSPKGSSVIIYVLVDKKNINISVKDEGIGIAKEDQKVIFNRFVQAKMNNSEHSGSGIGLELVNYLVKIHNGYISLNSELGKGSEFIITLPITLVDTEEKSKELIQDKKIEQLDIEFSDIYL